ncbi:MAG: CCDC90 family protein [Magnetococcus sp. XQGC-1]
MSTNVDVAFAFDTHKFVKQMVATGFTEEQAEAQVRLLSEILHTQLSTKADVAKVDVHVLELKRDIAAIAAKVETTKAELQKDIAILDGKNETAKETLRKEIEVAKNETIKWMIGLALAQLAMMAGILMTLVRVLPGGH